MVHVLGIDPGTSETGIALLGDGEPKVWLARASGRTVRERRIPMIEALCEILDGIETTYETAVIEWQMIRPGDPRPNDILELTGIAGAAIGIVAPYCKVLLPTPVQWKGSVPKVIHQRKLLRRLGLTSDSTCFEGIPKSLRHNAVDALGLAAWGMRDV